MCPRWCTALLLASFGQTSAIRLKEKASSSEAMHAFREKILFRFTQVDTDGDGRVSLEEMKSGFGHEPEEVGEGLLRQMLGECAGDPLALECTRGQMEKSLDAWVGSHAERTAMALFQSNPEHLFMDVRDQQTTDPPLPCGPSAALKPVAGLEGVACRVHGAKCVRDGKLVAWSLGDVCHGRTCLCEATAQTKRLAKVGLMGATAATTARDFRDPGDKMLMPACGNGWTGDKIVGRLDDLHTLMKEDGTRRAKEMMQYTVPLAVEHWDEEDFADTEVGFYKTATHELTKGKHNGKVCMFSWQATRSLGDWKINYMLKNRNFRYAPPSVEVMGPEGLVLSYDTVRGQLMRKFQDECCSPFFTADKIVISGHSHGGAMAALHAVDVISQWKCKGRDLSAKDVAVILVAPHSNMFTSSAITNLFSCSDPAACLAGSVATITTAGDFVGDPKMNVAYASVPRHPSEVFRVPCPALLPGANPNNTDDYEDFWCHGIHNYVPEVERLLVGQAGWGSSCGGVCGNPNRLVQCNQWALIAGTGCSYANKSWYHRATKCEGRWLPDEERCDCHFDLCTELTKQGCLP